VVFIGEYISQSHQVSQVNERKDYKEIFSPEALIRFAKFREIRKAMANEHSVPAYMIFTNEELAQIAQLKELTPKSVQSIPGVGAKRLEKFGEEFIQKHNNAEVQ